MTTEKRLGAKNFATLSYELVENSTRFASAVCEVRIGGYRINQAESTDRAWLGGQAEWPESASWCAKSNCYPYPPGEPSGPLFWAA